MKILDTAVLGVACQMEKNMEITVREERKKEKKEIKSSVFILTLYICIFFIVYFK